MQKFKINFFFSQHGKIRVKERTVQAENYEAAIEKLKKQYGVIKVFRMPEKAK